MKRIRTLIFAALLCCGATAQTHLPGRAVYEQYTNCLFEDLSFTRDYETVTVDNIEYKIYDNGFVFVKGCSPKAKPKDLVIPASITYNGQSYQVTAIGNWAFIDCKSLKTVVISDGIKLIGGGAFNFCTNLESVTIPKSVTYVDRSFMKCRKCTTVKDGVIYLGDILLQAADTSLTRCVIEEGTRIIAECAFSQCSSLTSVSIPKSVKSIGRQAFYENSRLESVEIPEGVEYIEGNTFSGCTNLKTAALPASLKFIGAYAFKDCGSLKTVNFPSNDIWIEKDAFDNGIKLPSEDGIRYGGTMLIEVVDKNRTSYTIKEGTTRIGEKAFAGCKAMKSLVVPESVTEIETDAFRGCTALQSVVLPKKLTSTRFNCFEECSSLESVIIPEGVTEIGSWGFAKCRQLKSVTFPKSLKSIRQSAFDFCGLEEVVIPEGVTEIGYEAFGGNDRMKSVVIPASVTWVSARAFDRCNIETVIDHVRFIDNIVVGVDDNSLSEYHIKSDARIIAGEAFQFCDRMTSITLPDGIVSIGELAFKGCSSLETINIPDGVTRFGELAFCDCTSLKSMELPASLTAIGANCFLNCDKLKHRLKIPDTVTEVDRKYLFKSYNYHWGMRKFLARLGL